MASVLKAIAKRGLRKIAGAMGVDEITEEIKTLRSICLTIQHQTAVAPDGLPVPPFELHTLVSGRSDLDVSEFFNIGRLCADFVMTSLQKHGTDMASLDAILDFGCGCGRVIRHFHAVKGPRLYGTDYNRTLIEWCRHNLPFAQFDVNELHPPLQYANETFGLIYAFSVFTHLPEPLQLTWRAELARLLRPGGYLVISTLGDLHADMLSGREREDYRAGRLVVLRQEAAGENCCAAYHSESYVRRTLAQGFDVLEFAPQAMGQDGYLLRKCS